MFNEEMIKKLDRKYASKEHHQDIKNDGAALMPTKKQEDYEKQEMLNEVKYGAPVLIDFLDDFISKLEKLRFKPGSRNERRMKNILWEMNLIHINAKALLEDMKENNSRRK